MNEIRTEIEINASAATVWEILTDFGRYSEWNPFIVEAAGNAAVDSKLAIKLDVAGKNYNFKPTVKVADAGRELKWLGRLFLPGLYDGEHSFVVTPLSDNRVRLDHSERFNGLLVPLINRGRFADNTTGGFQAMNEALKHQAEKK